jgi:hypothetical protein
LLVRNLIGFSDCQKAFENLTRTQQFDEGDSLLARTLSQAFDCFAVARRKVLTVACVERKIAFMRRAAIYIFTILLTFFIGSVTPALWEVSVILTNGAWADLRRSWEPLGPFNCVYLEPSKEPELIYLAAPLPPIQPEPSFPRKAQSNKGMNRTRK